MAGSVPARTAVRNNAAACDEGGPGPGSYTLGALTLLALPVLGPGSGTHTTQAPAKRREMDTHRLRPRAHTHREARLAHAARCPSPATQALRGPWTAAPGLAASRGRGSMPPARGAGVALTRPWRRSVSSARGAPAIAAARAASAASGRAGGRTRGHRAVVPRAGSVLPPSPRPGHARWSTPGRGIQEGVVLSGRGARGRPGPLVRGPSPRSLGSPPSLTGFPFHRREDREAERLPICCAPVEGGARCL